VEIWLKGGALSAQNAALRVCNLTPRKDARTAHQSATAQRNTYACQQSGENRRPFLMLHLKFHAATHAEGASAKQKEPI
jgi:hypothetical protein